MKTRIAAAALLVLSPWILAQDAHPGSVWDNRKSAWSALKDGERDRVTKFAEDYKAYLTVARTAETSTREVIRLAKAAGFSELKEGGAIKAGARLYVNGRDRALI